jgi:hypothetical protein
MLRKLDTAKEPVTGWARPFSAGAPRGCPKRLPLPPGEGRGEGKLAETAESRKDGCGDPAPKSPHPNPLPEGEGTSTAPRPIEVLPSRPRFARPLPKETPLFRIGEHGAKWKSAFTKA